MASLYTGGLWCPQCGDEYRPGFSGCSDCRVPLVDEKPQLRARSRDDGDHDQVGYDLDDWEEQQRGALELLLVGGEIPHGWESAHLVVPRVREAEVDELIEEVSSRTVSGDPIERQASDAIPDEVDAGVAGIAGSGRRFLGFAIDMIVLSTFMIGLSITVFHVNSYSAVGPRAVMFAVAALYEIVPIALWGRTIGKLVARTRIVDLATDAIPTWPQATVRWVVPVVVGGGALSFGSSSAIAGVVALVGFVCQFVVYGGVLWDRRRQGFTTRQPGPSSSSRDGPDEWRRDSSNLSKTHTDSGDGGGSATLGHGVPRIGC